MLATPKGPGGLGSPQSPWPPSPCQFPAAPGTPSLGQMNVLFLGKRLPCPGSRHPWPWALIDLVGAPWKAWVSVARGLVEAHFPLGLSLCWLVGSGTSPHSGILLALPDAWSHGAAAGQPRLLWDPCIPCSQGTWTLPERAQPLREGIGSLSEVTTCVSGSGAPQGPPSSQGAAGSASPQLVHTQWFVGWQQPAAFVATG